MATKKLGRPPAGGPRLSVRLKSDKQLQDIDKKVRLINNQAKYGEIVTRNSFIVEAIATALKKVKL